MGHLIIVTGSLAIHNKQVQKHRRKVVKPDNNDNNINIKKKTLTGKIDYLFMVYLAKLSVNSEYIESSGRMIS
jgi:hypothetical protein